jgi:hypothetical protein
MTPGSPYQHHYTATAAIPTTGGSAMIVSQSVVA